ncbi:MAG: Asp-tRNA(Asn)/Glu-tRNA(Gln) amidotransferase subunit GatA [bacterium]|nr:Asp-tRNA(Asn)/Glu-tRNA(Gln) amidotransferase subunit GatA [bacterium]
MMQNLKIAEIQNKIREGEFTCEQYLNFLLKNYDQRNQKLNCVLQIDKQGALDYARQIDLKISREEDLDPLFGVFIGVKDNIHARGFKSTCASKMLENFEPGFDATCVARLREAGAFILSKLNCDEFAMGSSNENSAFGIVRNPVAEDCVPGGSSGGSAAAVAANMVTVALGSDTGGSIRQPASFCGVVGLKPSYGSVSRYGLVAFASSLDQIGPLGSSAEDCELIFDTISWQDPRDGTSTIYESKSKDEPIKIGIVEEFFDSDADLEFKKFYQKILDELAKISNFELMKVSLPSLKYCLPVYYILSSAEASSNLARYDSVRYGPVLAESNDLLEIYKSNREKGFGKEVKRRILLGTYVLSEGYFDSYYKKALKIRSLLKREFERVMKEADILIGPTTPSTAFPIGDKNEDPLEMYKSDLFTVPANIIGCPAISVPVGNLDKKPLGLQLMALNGHEANLLNFTKIVQSQFDRSR